MTARPGSESRSNDGKVRQLRRSVIVGDSPHQCRESDMNKGDGSMTFDWIFFAIVVIPMAFAVWELFKTPKGLSSK